MSGFPILDLVVGMIFVFFLLSIISSSAVEMVLTVRKVRAKMLEEWLVGIFKPAFAKEIMDHCSITALSGSNKSPAYIDAKNFATVIIEKVTFDPLNPNKVAQSLDMIIADIEKTNLLPPELKRSFLVYAVEAKQSYAAVSAKMASEIDIFRSKLENWFDSSMDRVTGALKARHTRRLTFWLGAVIVIALNADSVAIAKYLYNNPEARVALAEKAYDATRDTALQQEVAGIDARLKASADPAIRSTADSIKQTITRDIQKIKTTKAALQDVVPLGWNEKVLLNENGHIDGWLILAKIIGLLASILAVMMGAPFWFDLLNKVSNLRGSGKKPQESDGPASIPVGAGAPVTLTVNTNPVEEAVG